MSGWPFAHDSRPTRLAPEGLTAGDGDAVEARAGDVIINFRELPTRLANVLMHNGILIMGDLRRLTPRETKALAGFGTKCMAEVENYLHAKGIASRDGELRDSYAAYRNGNRVFS